MAHDVFISYTTADKAVADAVCHRLEASGIRCWIAPRDVGYGKDWGASIVDAIGEAKLVVMILSAAANASHNVLDEVVTALDSGATVLPFRIEDVRPTGALRLRLSRLHWLDALSQPLDQHMDRLIESAKRIPAAEAEEARSRQEEEPRQAEEELQRRQQEEQRLKAEEEVQRRQQDEQRRQAEEELQRRQQAEQEQRRKAEEELQRRKQEDWQEEQRRFQAEKERRRQQKEPLRKPNEEPAHKREEEPPGPGKRFRHGLAVAAMVAVVIAAAFLLVALAQMLGGGMRPGQQTSSTSPAPLTAPALMRTLTGHSGSVNSIAFSSDGRTLASGSDDQTIKLWDPASGQLLRTLTGHTDSARPIAFSPDGHTLASGSWDNTIKLWDSASGQLLRTLTGHTDSARPIAFSPDGHTLASGSEDKTIKLWDVSKVNEAIK